MNTALEVSRTDGRPGSDTSKGTTVPKRMLRSLFSRSIVFIAGSLGLITAGHYLLSPDHHVLHNILQRLYYIPIVWAAFRYGTLGGTTASVVAGFLYLPHVLFGWQSFPEYQANQIIEIVLFIVIGLSGGYLFEQKSLFQRQLQSNARMALFGNLSRSILRSLKKPIRTMRGMLMALEPMEQGDPMLASSLRIIREEVTRIEGMRDDLYVLVERKKFRLKKQSLNDVMSHFLSQAETGLALRGVRVRRLAGDLKAKTFLNRPALIGVLHQLIGTLVGDEQPITELTFYAGQSASYVWLGATADDRQLEGYHDSELAVLDSQYYHEYELIPTIDVMNNHYGDVRFRWVDHRLVEFILVFPRRFRLPWYLRDEPIKTRDTVQGNEAGMTELHGEE